ncbi:arginase family protein [Phytoactinopolyspora halotolerans]|uniref:arginase family protein n=1 Tax=Phytoactinopolyspora halotolerans TaxID=1981512 RepID=UPI001C207B77|nr:arginase family protein [Phytoactinopolyspora halotolerans]
MSSILVPYHLDEYRPTLDVPIEPDTTVTVDFSVAEEDTWARMGLLYQRVADAVAADVQAGGRATVLSGDCTTSLGVVAGLQRTGLDPAIVWFDGHGDVQTLETTTSGYLGGMPLRMLMGYRPELIADELGLRPVAEDRVVLVDARDLDHAEIEYLHESAVARRGVYDFAIHSFGGGGDDGVDSGGSGGSGGSGDGHAVAAADPAELLPDGPIYLHLDLDVVDPSDLPDLLFPAPGGPGLDAVLSAVHRIVEVGQVVGIGIGCTWQPNHGSAERIGTRLSEALDLEHRAG